MKKRKQLNRSQRRIHAKSRCRRRRLAYLELQRQQALQARQKVQRKVLKKIDETIEYCQDRLAAEKDQPLVDPQLGTTPPEQFGVGIKPTPEPFNAYDKDGKYVSPHKGLEDLSVDSDFRPRPTLPTAEQRRRAQESFYAVTNSMLEQLAEAEKQKRPRCDENDLERLPTIVLPFRKYPDLELSGMADDEEIIERLRQSRFGFPPKDDHGPTFKQPSAVRVAKRPSLSKRIVGAVKRWFGPLLFN